jgi:hypothetical protein
VDAGGVGFWAASCVAVEPEISARNAALRMHFKRAPVRDDA